MDQNPQSQPHLPQTLPKVPQPSAAHKEEGRRKGDEERKSPDDRWVVIREPCVGLADVNGCERVAVAQVEIAASSHPVEHDEHRK